VSGRTVLRGAIDLVLIMLPAAVVVGLLWWGIGPGR
jgi:hypothetical protein